MLTTFTPEQANMLANLTLVSEGGNSPVALNTLGAKEQELIGILEGMDIETRRACGVSEFIQAKSGSETFVGLNVELNALGFPVTDSIH